MKAVEQKFQSSYNFLDTKYINLEETEYLVSLPVTSV